MTHASLCMSTLNFQSFDFSPQSHSFLLYWLYVKTWSLISLWDPVWLVVLVWQPSGSDLSCPDMSNPPPWGEPSGLKPDYSKQVLIRPFLFYFFIWLRFYQRSGSLLNTHHGLSVAVWTPSTHHWPIVSWAGYSPADTVCTAGNEIMSTLSMFSLALFWILAGEVGPFTSEMSNSKCRVFIKMLVSWIKSINSTLWTVDLKSPDFRTSLPAFVTTITCILSQNENFSWSYPSFLFA